MFYATSKKEPDNTKQRFTNNYCCDFSLSGCLLLQFSLTLLTEETLDGLLEFVVLRGIDKWVDTNIGRHQYHGKVVKPTDNTFSII